MLGGLLRIPNVLGVDSFVGLPQLLQRVAVAPPPPSLRVLSLGLVLCEAGLGLVLGLVDGRQVFGLLHPGDLLEFAGAPGDPGNITLGRWRPAARQVKFGFPGPAILISSSGRISQTFQYKKVHHL